MYPDEQTIRRAIALSGQASENVQNEKKIRPYARGRARYKEVIQDTAMLCEVIDQVEREAGIQPSCVKGCNACCRQSILVTRFETDMILDYVNQHYDAETVAAVRRRIEETAAKLDEAFGHPPKNEFEMAAMFKNQDKLKEQYFQLQLNCPMLNEQGECMVYPVRPAGCWSYRSYGNPADCDKDYYAPQSITYASVAKYQTERLRASILAGSLPKYTSFQLPGFLPQKLAEAMKS